MVTLVVNSFAIQGVGGSIYGHLGGLVVIQYRGRNFKVTSGTIIRHHSKFRVGIIYKLVGRGRVNTTRRRFTGRTSCTLTTKGRNYLFGHFLTTRRRSTRPTTSVHLGDLHNVLPRPVGGKGIGTIGVLTIITQRVTLEDNCTPLGFTLVQLGLTRSSFRGDNFYGNIQTSGHGLFAQVSGREGVVRRFSITCNFNRVIGPWGIISTFAVQLGVGVERTTQKGKRVGRFGHVGLLFATYNLLKF